jgi:hypothetical protein
MHSEHIIYHTTGNCLTFVQSILINLIMVRALPVIQSLLKGKGKIPVFFSEHVMKACWWSEGIAPLILWPRL